MFYYNHIDLPCISNCEKTLIFKNKPQSLLFCRDELRREKTKAKA